MSHVSRVARPVENGVAVLVLLVPLAEVSAESAATSAVAVTVLLARKPLPLSVWLRRNR